MARARESLGVAARLGGIGHSATCSEGAHDTRAAQSSPGGGHRVGGYSAGGYCAGSHLAGGHIARNTNGTNATNR
jgi:hypothetical protein